MHWEKDAAYRHREDGSALALRVVDSDGGTTDALMCGQALWQRYVRLQEWVTMNSGEQRRYKQVRLRCSFSLSISRLSLPLSLSHTLSLSPCAF